MNMELPSSSRDVGIVTSSSAVQPENTQDPTSVMPEFMDTDVSETQSANASEPMVLIDVDMVTD